MEITTVANHMESYLILAALIFAIGICGVMLRRTLIGMMISGELILAAAALNFMTFSRFLAPDPTTGRIFTLFIMGIAAAEAAIGMSIFIAVYRNYKSVETERVSDLNG